MQFRFTKLSDNRFVQADCLILILFLTAAIYWPGLEGGYLLDDYENLAPIDDLERGGNLLDAIGTNESGMLGRPVSMLSFAANTLASGKLPWPMKYTNLMIHLLCGTLLFWLTGRLLWRHPLFDKQRWNIALFVSSAWLLAPFLASTVLYIVQRMAQLSALFMICGLLAYVIGRQNLEHNFRRAMALILSTYLVWLPLAILSKENGALLPLLVIIIELYFFRFRTTARPHRLFLSSIHIIFVALPLIAAMVMTAINPEWVVRGYAAREFTLIERLYTESRILFNYLFNLLLPNGRDFGVYHDDYMKSTGLLTPISTLASMAGWISIILLAILTWKKPHGIFFFGLIFYLAGHTLESTIFPLELYFEHRNYLPSYGIFLCAGMLIFHLLSYGRERTAVIMLLIAMIPATYAVATYNRAHTWSSWKTLLLSSAVTHPNSPRLNVELATYKAATGDLNGGLINLEKTIQSDQRLSSPAALQRVVLYCLAGEAAPNSVYSRLETELTPFKITYLIATFKRLTELIIEDKCAGLDATRFAHIINTWLIRHKTSDESLRWMLHIHLAKIYHHLNNAAAAEEQLDHAWEIWPHRPEAGLLKISYQLEKGQIQAAKITLEKLIATNGGYKNDYNTTIEFYKRVIESTNTNPPP